MADQISDAILDAMLANDPMSRVACETLVTTGLAIIAGEVTTSGYVDIPSIVRDTIKGIGYDRESYGYDGETVGVMVSLDQGSSWSAPAPLWDGGPVPVAEAIFHGGQAWVRGSDGSVRVSGENRARNRLWQIGGATRLVGCSRDLAAIEDGGSAVILIASGVAVGRAAGQLAAVFADGVAVAAQWREDGVPMVCLETALPAKFEETIREALGRDPERPAAYRGIEHLAQRYSLMPADVPMLKRYIAAHAPAV
jgi:hypothetical protein